MLRNVFLLVLSAILFYNCSNKTAVKPTVVLIKTDASNSVNCFGPNKGLDTLNTKNDKTLKRYFGSMVPAPSRSSLFVKRE